MGSLGLSSSDSDSEYSISAAYSLARLNRQDACVTGPPLQLEEMLQCRETLDSILAHPDLNPSNAFEVEQPASPVIDLTQDDDDHQAAVAEPDIHLPLPDAVRARFRLQAKYFFLTWPQCDTPKEVVLERIKALPHYDYAVVCRENHQDATGVHLHAFVAFKQQINRKGIIYLDDLAGKHGNYQSARDNAKVVRYVTEEGDYIADGFDPLTYLMAALSHKSTKNATKNGKSKAFIVADLIINGKNIDDIDAYDPGYVLMNKRKIEDYVGWQRVKKARLDKLAWPGIDFTHLLTNDENDPTLAIAIWLDRNIRRDREFKKKQLYIYSDGPDAGKTHLVNELTKYLTVYHLPKQRFIDGYESNRYDLVVIDEFKAQHTVTFLNEFVQGGVMHLDQKGSGHIKTDNPPIIILSNYAPEECFRKANTTKQFATFLSRFEVVKIPEKYKIDVFHTL